MVVWALASLALAWYVKRAMWVYWGSVVLATPAIALSMCDHGLLPMGGIFHALCAGAYAIPFHYTFKWIRRKPSNTQGKTTIVEHQSPADR